MKLAAPLSPLDNREESEMPRILIVTDSAENAGEVVYAEQLVPAHLQTEHSGRLLVERLAWAVEDARRVERNRPETRRPVQKVDPTRSNKEKAWIRT
jgi:predicted outer membrane protein